MGGGDDLEHLGRAKALHLTGQGLRRIPKPVLRSVGLVRLDLACNDLSVVPSSISTLVNLEYLWLQVNPITSVHADIQHCTRLKVLDLRDTALANLPREMSRLPTILEVDLRGAPLKAKMKGFQRNTKGLMEYLKERDARKRIKVELFNKLSTGLYREVLDSPTGRRIGPLIKAVCLAFADLQELTQVTRHCERLFPADLASAGEARDEAARLKKNFRILGRKNERKRLASRLELKMRAIYYDVIDPSAVEGYIASIYQQVELLEDVQFLVRHAAAIMPPDPENITGQGVLQSMLALQKEMTDARQRCVDGLLATLAQMYSDQEPSKVALLAGKVAAVFAKGKRFADSAELEELKQLKAEAQASVFSSLSVRLVSVRVANKI
eukprot:jgi/Undpi1/96/HiC_scaffold_1.g00096.m1